ncbi:MAG: SDR family NAD(P)-dependent oxidoreductase [Acidobacteriota bacterium]
MDWKTKNVLVTGGCSFIGSHLVDGLVERGAKVRVVDDLSSGVVENVQQHLTSDTVEFVEADLLEPGEAERAVEGQHVVFHLAATHGGRGFIDLHQAACSTNLALDGLVIRAAHRAGVEQLTFASSGCVYPTDLQQEPTEEVYLTEDLVTPPYQADDMYGWAKLMSELTLRAYHEDYGFKCASVRYFTAYGERCPMNHAVVAMIARAFIGQDPFIVWGTGEQVRNWTHVSDIANGTILAAEKIEDGTAVNLGTEERTTVMQAAQEILRRCSVDSKIQPDPSKPTGPYNRVASNKLAGELLGWQPAVTFNEGLDRTIQWFYENHDREEVARDFDFHLTERGKPEEAATTA